MGRVCLVWGEKTLGSCDGDMASRVFLFEKETIRLSELLLIGEAMDLK